ncbi:Mu transposase domain-containing protein, partial [Marinitoga litoralis]|uniref:Mu transposase domain-containing protein n=1 Tax=Marinitoga litoralis TaxID=570855 RepID=UPI003B848B46|nr:hypothetical protein [Marinitoga litoralis]
PPKYEFAIVKEAYVDKYSTITLNNCRYSVPAEYTNKWLKVKIYPEKIIIYDEKPIAEHTRVYGINKWQIKIEHYLSILKRKPGALHNSLVLHQAPKELKEIYHRYFTTNVKEFIMLLEYIYENSIKINKIKNIIDELEKISPKDISLAKIKILSEKEENKKEKIKYEGAIEQYSRNQIEYLKELIKL